jgi:hypothetical protein
MTSSPTAVTRCTRSGAASAAEAEPDVSSAPNLRRLTSASSSSGSESSGRGRGRAGKLVRRLLTAESKAARL